MHSEAAGVVDARSMHSVSTYVELLHDSILRKRMYISEKQGLTRGECAVPSLDEGEDGVFEGAGEGSTGGTVPVNPHLAGAPGDCGGFNQLQDPDGVSSRYPQPACEGAPPELIVSYDRVTCTANLESGARRMHASVYQEGAHH